MGGGRGRTDKISLTDTANIGKHAKTFVVDCIFGGDAIQKNLRLSYLIMEGNFTAVTIVILQAEKFLKCDWLRKVVFKPNLKYLHVKITPSFHGN